MEHFSYNKICSNSNLWSDNYKKMVCMRKNTWIKLFLLLDGWKYKICQKNRFYR